jgi:hypothetical protein
MSKKITDTPWDRARSRVLIRPNGYPEHPLEKLDRGVNYFVEKLESLNIKTEWSCEGHPNGFYIVFWSSLSWALNIGACGFFSVELEGAVNGCAKWSLRINRPFKTEAEKRQCLRWAAAAWEAKLTTPPPARSK